MHTVTVRTVKVGMGRMDVIQRFTGRFQSLTATTDGAGKFTLKQVPASSTWLVLADVDGNRMAGVVKPNTKKTVDCKITLTTTLAISGIQPYFVEDPKAPDRVVYDLRDLPLDKFDALVAAIDNSSSKPEIKPSPRIKDLNGTFTSLKDKDQAVAKHPNVEVIVGRGVEVDFDCSKIRCGEIAEAK